MPLPLRLCYSGRVLRHTEMQAGKDREIFQAGVELIGLKSPEADAEMIAMAVECLKNLGAGDFTIDIGQVEFFRGVMENLPVSGDRARQIQAAIARKDNSGLKELLADLSLTEQARAEVMALPRLFGGREVLQKAENVVSNDRSRQALSDLKKVLDILEVYGVEDHVTFDLGELRGLDYHTGVTFQGFLTGFGRAVCFGGRYDNLTAAYGYPAPATGFAFNLLNLLFALDKRLDELAVCQTDVLIFQSAPDKELAQRLAQTLRKKGISAARDIIPRDLEGSLAYARKMNFRYVMILSPTQDIRLVNLSDGSEKPVSYQSIQDESFVL